MPVDRDDDLVFGNAELLRRCFDDPAIGLVRHEPVDLVARNAGCGEGLFDHVGDHADRVLEHFAAFHAQMAGGARRRRPAIDIELVLVPAVRTQMGRQNARVRCQPDAGGLLDDNGAGAIAEEHGGTPVGPVENARERLRADHQDTPRQSGPDVGVGGGQRVDEAGAYGLDVERGAMVHAKPVLDVDGRGRKRVVGRRSGDDDQVDIVGGPAGIVERRARSGFSQRRAGFVVAGDIALRDARALPDPCVGGFELGLEFGVRNDPFRQCGADAGDG